MAEIRKINNLDELNGFVKEEDGKAHFVKLYADWCFPCKVLTETIKNLTEEETGDVLFAEANVDDEWFDEKAVELKVRGIPVVIAYKDGEEVDRLVGGAPKDVLINFIGKNR